MKVMTGGFDVITVTGKYSFASIEYAGRVAYSMVDRGGTAAKQFLATGKYIPVTIEYAGRVAHIVVDRGGTAAKQLLATGKYIPVTIEYAGRVVYSMVDRGGTATKTKKYLVKFFQPIGSAGGRPFAFVKDKVFQPVGSAVSRPFVFVKDKAKSIFPAQLRYDEDMKNLLEKVMKIEDRLVYIEKHGVVMKGEAAEEKKAISKEKSMLLQVILAENKLLRKAGRK